MPIHIFKNSEGFKVWTCAEGEVPKQQGRCIGAGKTLHDAVRDGEEELLKELNQLALNPPAVIEEGK